jgi:hypothetical protein
MALNKCMFCQINPRSHSFREIYDPIKNQLSIRIFYSRPADAELYLDTASVVHHFECELTDVNNWEWIFDCEGMNFSHYIQFRLVKELCELFKRHGGLQFIKIINAGWLVNMTVRCAMLLWPQLPSISIHRDDISK